MDVQTFPLDRVQPNPYQMRLSEDPEHIAGLADSIEAQGLIEIPTARPHPKKAGQVQLASGHSRLAAFRLLRQRAKDDGQAFEAFPVAVRDLSDREMSDLAAAENARRRNLSPMETAKALLRRIEDFKLTQAEAGAPFGYAPATVSNFLRLLDLPAEVQTQVDSGEIPQRLARQLVNVAHSDPKAVRKIAKAVAKAPPADREEIMADQMAAQVRQHLHLRDAPWDAHWLATPRPLDAELANVISGPVVVEATEAGLGELRACSGCPHRLVYGQEDYCTLKACYQAKLRLYDDQAATRVSDRLGIPRALHGEAVVEIGDILGSDFYYMASHKVAQLIKAAPKMPELGLRVTAGAEAWYWERLTGEKRAGLGTVAPDQVKAFCKRNESASTAKARAAAKDPEKAQELEAEAAAARRAERAAKQRAVHDCAWLVRHVVPIVADQLAISGPVLAYVVDGMQNVQDSGSRNFPGLGGLDEELREAAAGGPAKNRDATLRQALVAGEILHHVFDYSIEHSLRSGDVWEDVRRGILRLATGRDPDGNEGLGFGVKLPAGWDKPPIHRTPWNCWHCGVFTGAERVTKRDQAAGWIVRGDPEKPEGVWCSEAHRAAFVKAATSERKPDGKKAKK